MSAKRTSSRPSPAWLVGLGLGVAWIATLTVLILVEPDPGAGSVVELAQRAGPSIASGDAGDLASLLAPHVDADFADAYVDRLAGMGVHGVVAVADGETVLLRGSAPTGGFESRLVSVEVDGRWFLSPLPTVAP